MRWPWQHPVQESPDAAFEEADAAVQRGEQAVRVARAAHEFQRCKREEDSVLMQRLDQLAGSDSNHLGRLVLDALTESRREGA